MKTKQRFTALYVRPLTVALVAIVFVSLILFMGLMDLSRLDRTLIGFMENRGLDIITTVEKLSQENQDYLYVTLRRGSTRSRGDEFTPIIKDPITPQGSLIKSLVELARDIDIKWQAGELSLTALKRIVERENLWLVTILDHDGRIVLKSRDFKEQPPGGSLSASSVEGNSIVDLLRKFGDPDEVGYIALRRKDGKGTIVVALDNKGLKYWSTKVAVNKTIEEVGWGHGLAYLMVMDTQRKVLGKAGSIPALLTHSDMIAAKIIAGTTPLISRKVVYDQEKMLEIFAPIRLDGEIVGYARLGLERAMAEDVLKKNKTRMFLFTILIGIIGILSIWLLYQNQNRHLKRMEELSRKLDRAERLSSLGRLAAGVAHEIRNPLNAISIATQRLQRGYASSESGNNAEEKRQECLRITGIIREEIKRLNGIIEEFLTFFRSRRLELHEQPLTPILQKIVLLMEEEARSRGIVFQTQWDSRRIMVPMDRDKLTQAFLNILKNAMESISGHGTITLAVADGVNNHVEVKITDTGVGLSPEEIDNIFNPDYTTKEKGLGLGLPLAHEIIHGHQGEVTVESTPGEGTTFVISFPLEQQ